jgi:hypothetical protein
MFLPNGVPVTKVNKKQIFFQVVNFERKSGEGSSFSGMQATPAGCFSVINSNAAYVLGNEDKTSSPESLPPTLLSDFPKGGPRQSTWLDMSDLLQNIYSGISGDYERVIEVGILELDPYKVKLLMSYK